MDIFNKMKKPLKEDLKMKSHVQIFPKFIYKFSVIPIKFQLPFLQDWQMDPKICIWKYKGFRIAKQSFFFSFCQNNLKWEHDLVTDSGTGIRTDMLTNGIKFEFRYKLKICGLLIFNKDKNLFNKWFYDSCVFTC